MQKVNLKKNVFIIRKAPEILNYFKNRNINLEYLKDHALRYEYLLKKINSLIQFLQIQRNIKTLDIGPAYQTEILRINHPDVVIDSLGFYDPEFLVRPQDQHIQFNLNDAQFKKNWLKIKKYDIIIIAEVIEHLYTSPKLVLGCITTWLKKGGYLIIQTPNAVSLNRRIKMLIGRNPYDMIRETHLNPGHFREYSIAELISVGRELGLNTKDYDVRNYFRHSGLTGTLYNICCSFLPESLRDGITLCFQKK